VDFLRKACDKLGLTPAKSSWIWLIQNFLCAGSVNYWA
jgi:hypothetical protein